MNEKTIKKHRKTLPFGFAILKSRKRRYFIKKLTTILGRKSK